MAMWERHTQKLCPKGPSFSSSLLDAIYRSIDDSHKPQDFPIHRRNNNANTRPECNEEDDVESLRRAIMIEKWIETYTTRHFPSNSASSTDSSLFSSSSSTSSSASASASKTKAPAKREGGGRFAKTKTRAQKIYGDSLKKVKEPISPGGKISNFFNSIFSPRNFKTNQCSVVDDGDEWSSTIRKSRSMKDTATCPLTSRSCLSKNASSRASKSKRSVRFCPVINDDDDYKAAAGSYNDEFPIKKDFDHDHTSFRVFEAKNSIMRRKYEVRDYYRSSEQDLDALSCASSDLFELENIGRFDIGEELPVYETTSLSLR